MMSSLCLCRCPCRRRRGRRGIAERLLRSEGSLPLSLPLSSSWLSWDRGASAPPRRVFAFVVAFVFVFVPAKRRYFPVAFADGKPHFHVAKGDSDGRPLRGGCFPEGCSRPVCFETLDEDVGANCVRPLRTAKRRCLCRCRCRRTADCLVRSEGSLPLSLSLLLISPSAKPTGKCFAF